MMKNRITEKMLRAANGLAIFLILILPSTCPAVTLENGVSNEEIVLGQTTALTGPLAELGKDFSLGAKTYFDYINAKGGINGRRIRLITLDDGYNVDKAVKNVKKLIGEERVFSLFNVIGTPANIAMLPIIEKEGIPNFAPATGATVLREPFNRLIFNVRASYGDEIEKIVEHCSIRGLNRIGVVYQNNAFGKDGLTQLENILKIKRMSVLAAAPLASDGSDVDIAVKTLVASNPQVVLIFTAGKSSAAFIKTYNLASPNMQFMALSAMGTQASLDALGKSSFGLVVAQVAPFPFSGTNPTVMEFQKVMQKAGIKNWSFSLMEGFLSAKVFAEGVKHAGKNLTRKSLVVALESFGRADIDGYYVDYSNKDHHGSHFVDLTIVSKSGKFIR